MRRPRASFSAIPLAYAACAIAAGLTLPRLESRLLPEIGSPVSVSSALAIYSAVGSGMIALTGIVFGLAFVMVQFAATAYSPRLVLWISRDPILPHSIGIFTATFLYSIAAIAWVDRNRAGGVPMLSALLVVALLVVSVIVFTRLVARVGLLQVTSILRVTGDQGRQVIATAYRVPYAEGAPAAPAPDSPVTQTLAHSGAPQIIQTVDLGALAALARAAGGSIEVVAAVGDTLVDGSPLLRVRGAKSELPAGRLLSAFQLGDDRTFEQDPKYALRLLVDVAIKALSPAVNDPTTAVQALDQVEDLLRRLSRRRLDVGAVRDEAGRLLVTLPVPSWEDFLLLGLDEIRFFGATSVQVMRRMRALVADLLETAPEGRRPALRRHLAHLDATIESAFAQADEKAAAAVQDRQGIGVPRASS